MTKTLTIEGYASVFGKADLNQDQVAEGAFLNCLEHRRPREIKLLYQHDPKAIIGVWQEIREDDYGLYVKGQILGQGSEARLVQALIEAGALDGLSIGFITKAARRPDLGSGRILTQIDLWEISVVSFPMLPQARFRRLPTPTQYQDQRLGRAA